MTQEEAKYDILCLEDDIQRRDKALEAIIEDYKNRNIATRKRIDFLKTIVSGETSKGA